MTISLDLVGFVWVFELFECDVIGAIVKKLRLGSCLFGLWGKGNIQDGINAEKID